MDYFTNIIDIIKPGGKIDIVKNNVTIEYADIKLTHLVETKNFTVQSNDYLSYHIVRLIATKIGIVKDEWIQQDITISNELTSEYFICLQNIFQTSFYNYCTICGIKHDKLGLSYITTCSNPKCIAKSFHYPISNKITEFYKYDSSTLILLIQTILSALNHPKVEKIFNPIPIIYSISDVKSLISLVPKNLLENKLDDLIKLIAESFDDFYLWKKINNNLVYALIMNTITNNYYSISSFKDLVGHDLKKKILITENPTNNDKIEFFNINYSTEIETKIKSQLDDSTKYYYLYHGSPFHCWYSIIKNGLKVMSNTEFMTTGAAYGAGIYLSNDINVSYSYGRQCPPFNYNMIGVFQIIENPDKYCKATGFYVVPNEKILILRTLIKFNSTVSSLSSGIFRQLNNYFIRERVISKSASEISVSSLKNKRLSGELKLIERLSEKFKVVRYTDENNTPWLIELYIKDKLYSLEITFHNYPLNPPLLKLIDFDDIPVGIIDKDYKINIPILEVANWKVTTKIVEILNTIATFVENTY